MDKKDSNQSPIHNNLINDNERNGSLLVLPMEKDQKSLTT